MSQLIPSLVGQAHLYEGLGLFEAGELCSNLVTVGNILVKTGTVITSCGDGGIVGDALTVPVFTGFRASDLPPTLQILSHYASRFSIEHLFRDNKAGEFDLEACRIRDATSLERLYLVIAIATVYATLQGLDVQQQQQRRRIDIHWDRGLSFLKLGLCWIRGAVYQGWQLLAHWRCSLHIHLLQLAVPAARLRIAFMPSSSTGSSVSPQHETRGVLSVSEGSAVAWKRLQFQIEKPGSDPGFAHHVGISSDGSYSTSALALMLGVGIHTIHYWQSSSLPPCNGGRVCVRKGNSRGFSGNP